MVGYEERHFLTDEDNKILVILSEEFIKPEIEGDLIYLTLDQAKEILHREVELDDLYYRHPNLVEWGCVDFIGYHGMLSDDIDEINRCIKILETTYEYYQDKYTDDYWNPLAWVPNDNTLSCVKFNFDTIVRCQCLYKLLRHKLEEI